MGFRPAAPDELPILDNNHWENLRLVVEPDRNRILLAPVTAIIADLVQPQESDLLLIFMIRGLLRAMPFILNPTKAKIAGKVAL